MLEMSEKFTNDTFGNNLNLFPLVVITYLSGENLHISTNNVSFDGNYYKPILLNVPNIKESIDLENRNYKISNANLSISNFPVNGEVFSDSLLDSSGNYIINAEVDIYWKSQSCTSLEDCLHIYHGVVRRVKHDSDKVTLSIEDLSQKELHKDLPSTYLPDDDTVLEKNKNKPIPMVYGYVDKSPCMIDNVLEEYQDGNYDIAIDTQDITLNGDNPLWVYRDDTWVQILKVSPHFLEYYYADTRQYSTDNNEIKLLSIYDGDDLNAIADNQAEGLYRQDWSRYKDYGEDDNFHRQMNRYWFYYQYIEGLDEQFTISETPIEEWGDEDRPDYRLYNNRRRRNYQFQAPLDGIVEYYLNVDCTISNHSGVRGVSVLARPVSSTTTPVTYSANGSYSLEVWGESEFVEDFAITFYFSRPAYDFDDWEGGHTCDVDFTLNELYASVYPMLDKFLTSDFYADVDGRTGATKYTEAV